MSENAYRCPECDFEWEGDERNNKCPQCGTIGEIIHDITEKFKPSIESEPKETDDELPDQETQVSEGVADRRAIIRPIDLRPEIEKLYDTKDKKTKEFIETSLKNIKIECEEDECIVVRLTDEGKIDIIKGDRDRSIPWHRLPTEEQQELWDEFNDIMDEVEKLK